VGYVAATNTADVASSSSGLPLLTTPAAAGTYTGRFEFALMDAATFKWVYSGTLVRTDVTVMFTSTGTKTLSQELDRLRLTTLNGIDTFDAGSINIQYEL
jgi:hypothetical protein